MGCQPQLSSPHGTRPPGEPTVSGRGRPESTPEALSRGLGPHLGLPWAGVGRSRWSHRLADMGLWKGWVEPGVPDPSSQQGRWWLGSSGLPEALHLIRMAQARASSSARFLRFFSDSSEEPRKSVTSSTVTSPVVSSVVSALVAESIDMGESVASGGCGVSVPMLRTGLGLPSWLRGARTMPGVPLAWLSLGDSRSP